jgi:DNA-binding LacI/PurR family transcriptional regulator
MKNGAKGAISGPGAADPGVTNGRPPTAADVGRLAGVSRSTVSLVLNRVPDSRIPDETRERVRAAAEQLGYVPHAAASALRGGHNNLVLIPFLSRPYSPGLNVFFDALAGRLSELGYTVMSHRERIASGPDLVKQWAALRPVGVIIEPYRLDDQAREILHKAGTRAILTSSTATSDPNAPGWVEQQGKVAAEHLIATGHDWLAAVVPRDPRLSDIGLQHLQGVERVARRHGVQVERIDLAWGPQDAFDLAQRWRRNPHASGVLAFNDEYATVLMRALLDAGIAIPGDVAIVGCENLWLCDYLRPRLTSIETHPEVLGRSLAERLHTTILGLPDPPGDLIEPTLVLRDSA